jgi:hypothetical protein
MKSRVALVCLLLCSLLSSLASAGLQPPVGGGPVYQVQPGTRELPPRHALPAGPNPSARIAFWNEAAQRANALDHTPAIVSGAALEAEQLGPTRSSRALAIVQIAVYDAVNAILKRYPGYSGPLPAFADSSQDAAIAQAAHDTLVALYPRQAERFDAWLRADLASLARGRATLNGIDVGRRAAAAILALRAGDGNYYGEPIVGVDYQVGSFGTLSQAEEENGQSRIYLGVHWQFDKTEGVALGHRIADYVFLRGLVRPDAVSGAAP